MLYPVARSIFVPLLLVLVIASVPGCGSALKPEQTPTRVVINFMKAAGRNDITAAGQYVSPESSEQVGTWRRSLIYPDISEPPTVSDESRINRFIGSLYRFTVMDETETTAKVYVIFTASDSLMGFPSVADNPQTPVSATWTVMLSRSVQGEGDDTTYTEWIIDSFETGGR